MGAYAIPPPAQRRRTRTRQPSWRGRRNTPGRRRGVQATKDNINRVVPVISSDYGLFN